MNILYDDFGCYYIGFFIAELNMELHSKQFLPLFSDNTATILHEYIHYLQDISTLRGISSITSLSKKLQLVFSQANTPEYQFVLPIRLSQIKEMNSIAAFNDEVLTIEKGDNQIPQRTMGNIDRIILETDNIQMLMEEYPDAAHPSAIGYQNVEIYFDKLKCPYKFGSDCIAESMAYLSERVLCNSFERNNELPYNACELLCSFSFPNLSLSPTILIAICELSLMGENSGKLFYDILHNINAQNLSFNSVVELERTYSRLFNQLCDGLSSKHYEVMECLDFLYPTDIPVSESDIALVNSRMKERITRGIHYRKEQGLFISKAIESKNLKAIEKMFASLGIPLLIDKNKDIFSDDSLLPLLAPLAIYNSFFSELEKERKCFLYDFCKQQSVPIYDESYCARTPWQQVNGEKICPYALYIHRYALNPNNIKLRN